MPNPLDWLGAVMPRDKGPAPTREQILAENKRKQKQRGEQSQLRKDVGTLGDIAGDFIGGLTGFGGDSSQDAGKYGELIGAISDLLPGKAAVAKGVSLAGYPFAWYKAQGKIPRHGLLHGSPDVIEKIDPAYTNAGAHNMDFYGTPSPNMSNDFWERGQNDIRGPSGMTLPFEPEAKNVLDLIDIDPADMHKVMRNLEPATQARYMDYFNDMMSKGYSNREAYANIANVMGLPKGVAEKAGFDAVRFPYGDKLDETGKVVKDEAWGISNKVPIYSTYGRAPMNQAAIEGAEQTKRDIRRAAPIPETKPSGPGISVAPEDFKPPAGAILPSGRKMPVKIDVPKAPTKEAEELKELGFEKKRMSLAELMASGPKKPEMRTVKLPNGKIVQITKEEFDKMRGGRR